MILLKEVVEQRKRNAVLFVPAVISIHLTTKFRDGIMIQNCPGPSVVSGFKESWVVGALGFCDQDVRWSRAATGGTGFSAKSERS